MTVDYMPVSRVQISLLRFRHPALLKSMDLRYLRTLIPLFLWFYAFRSNMWTRDPLLRDLWGLNPLLWCNNGSCVRVISIMG